MRMSRMTRSPSSRTPSVTSTGTTTRRLPMDTVGYQPSSSGNGWHRPGAPCAAHSAGWSRSAIPSEHRPQPSGAPSAFRKSPGPASWSGCALGYRVDSHAVPRHAMTALHRVRPPAPPPQSPRSWTGSAPASPARSCPHQPSALLQQHRPCYRSTWRHPPAPAGNPAQSCLTTTAPDDETPSALFTRSETRPMDLMLSLVGDVAAVPSVSDGGRVVLTRSDVLGFRELAPGDANPAGGDAGQPYAVLQRLRFHPR